MPEEPVLAEAELAAVVAAEPDPQYCAPVPQLKIVVIKKKI